MSPLARVGDIQLSRDMPFDPVQANQPLLEEISRFRQQQRLTRSRFGREALNDPALIPELERGRQLSPRSLYRLRSYMDRRECEAS